ncbi:hypothetical protein ACXZ9C_11715 [Streptococcus agalactiae]
MAWRVVASWRGWSSWLVGVASWRCVACVSMHSGSSLVKHSVAYVASS